MNIHLRRFKICGCPGSGCPDKRLVRLADGRIYALELKLSQGFFEDNTNRVVLTSASEKLRLNPPNAAHHLVATVFYRQTSDKLVIDSARADFLQPLSRANIRFEASTSQPSLSSTASHFSWFFKSGHWTFGSPWQR